MQRLARMAVKYITADELAALIKSKPASELAKIAVVDVRDDDFAGGNIVNAINQPSREFHENAPGLVNRLKDVPQVVFHCALSQVRGPKSARIYSETRDEILGDAKPAQEVLVLREGFTGFQTKFRDDKELVEKFNKFYHD